MNVAFLFLSNVSISIYNHQLFLDAMKCLPKDVLDFYYFFVLDRIIFKKCSTQRQHLLFNDLGDLGGQMCFWIACLGLLQYPVNETSWSHALWNLCVCLQDSLPVKQIWCFVRFTAQVLSPFAKHCSQLPAKESETVVFVAVI